MITKIKFLQGIKEGKIKFPNPRIGVSEEKLIQMFNELKKVSYINNVFYNKINYVRTRNFFNDYNIPNDNFTFNNKHVFLYAYNKNFALSDMFQYKYRMQCHVYGNPYSPWDLFYNDASKIYDEIKQWKKNMNADITELDIIVSIKTVVKQCTTFNLYIMIYFIQIFKAKSVLDFSAGWGDRLIGCIAAGVDYVGVDPNPNLHDGYKKIIATFSNKKNKYVLIKNTIQDAILPKGKKYDLIFTSPPYFDLEIYVKKNKPGGDKQSSIFENENEWYENFLKVAIKKCWNVLKTGGIMAINIEQKHKKETYIEKMINYVHNELKDGYYLGVIFYGADKDTSTNPIRPVWIFRKIKKNTPHDKIYPSYIDI